MQSNQMQMNSMPMQVIIFKQLFILLAFNFVLSKAQIQSQQQIQAQQHTALLEAQRLQQMQQMQQMQVQGLIINY